LRRTRTVAPETVAPSAGSTIFKTGLASSCSPRWAIWSLIFCGSSVAESVCAVGDGVAAAFVAFVAALLASGVELQPAAASASAQQRAAARVVRRESFI
jgi:hypothetical protein